MGDYLPWALGSNLEYFKISTSRFYKLYSNISQDIKRDPNPTRKTLIMR